MRLTGKVILITGAAGRIGAALAEAVVREGGKASLVDIDSTRIASLKKKLGDLSALELVADAGNPDEVGTCIEKTVDHFGHLDAVVHSAYPRSNGWGAKFEDLDANFLFEDLSRQLGGAILLSKSVLIFFKKQGHGNLIHISSIQGIAAPKFEHYEGANMGSPIEYSAIKAGLIAITRYLAKYYMGNHIRVNCISPGGILDNQPEAFIRKYRTSCSDKGMLDSDDVIGALLFLLSDSSRYVTGQNIIIDDGWSL